LILEKIVTCKREEVAQAKRRKPQADLMAQVYDLDDQTRGFERALRRSANSGRTTIIAEVKKGSPSKGIIRGDFDPIQIAEIYQRNHAVCVSVLTDERFFYGHLDYLSKIRERVSLPLLRKDFICDPYQIFEARANGADAVLLIAAMLELSQLVDFSGIAAECGLDVLLEIHNQHELETALDTDVALIGINNRDLNTFKTDLAITEALAPLIPEPRLVVAESGIHQRDDILRLQKAGAKAFLVGESLMREPDISRKLKDLLEN
jgi:indole-3-glycerol phosphate synthase